MATQVRARTSRKREVGPLTRVVSAVFTFFRYSEFEILFLLLFFVAFLIFKDLTSRPHYNQILVKKPGGVDWWPY